MVNDLTCCTTHQEGFLNAFQFIEVLVNPILHIYYICPTFSADWSPENKDHYIGLYDTGLHDYLLKYQKSLYFLLFLIATQ